MFNTITDEEIKGKGVQGLPDTPGLSTAEMQAKFDELSRDVIIPKINELVGSLNETGIYEKQIVETVNDSDSEIPTSAAVVKSFAELGGGDMMRATYDKSKSGIVDDSEKLGGKSPDFYASKTDVENEAAERQRQIDEVASGQIPDEYLQARVDEYLANNDGGLATKEDISNLSSEITNINDSLGLFKESDIINVSPTPICINYELFTGLSLPHGTTIRVKVEMIRGRLDVIQINANNRFVRSIEKNKFGEFVNIELRNDTYLPASDNPIITNIGFRVDEEYYTSDISFRITIYTNGLQADVDRLMKNDIIPPYYHNHLNEKCNKINSEVGNIQSGDVFIFVTDQHIAGNTLTSFPLMETVIQKTSCNKVVFGGDIPANYGTQEECNEQIVTWRKGFKKLSCNSEIFVVRGNHDISTNDNGEFHLSSDSEVYNYLMRSFEKETMINRKNYYYHDVLNQKIRYIFVDCFETKNDTTYIPYISQEQINWLIDKLNVNEGWSVVVFGHSTCDSKMVDYSVNMTNLFNILKAYKNKTVCESSVNNINVNKDFTDYKGDLVAYICGHSHKDEGVVTDNVISISTTCDALYQDDVHTRTKGTTTESAFDVFVIDTTSKSIKAIRIGAGYNREWTY